MTFGRQHLRPEERHRIAKRNSWDVGNPAPTTLQQLKTLVAQGDALTPSEQQTAAEALRDSAAPGVRDWGRLFFGGPVDKLHGRKAIYRRPQPVLALIRDELDSILNP